MPVWLQVQDRNADREETDEHGVGGEEMQEIQEIQIPHVMAAIPAYNEEAYIGSVVLRARNYVDEVLVVDDGSTDRTAEVAKLAGAIVVKHNGNRGYGSAVCSCLKAARENSTDILVILDGDGQHDPSQIPKVVDPVLRDEADICIGSRFLDGESNHVPAYRKLGIGVLSRLTNMGAKAKDRVNDGQSGFRAYSRKAIEKIQPREQNMGVSAEILMEARRKKMTFKEVPITCDYGAGAHSVSPVRHGFDVIGSIGRYVETEHALLTFGVPGFIMFVMGLALGIHVWNTFAATSELAVGLALITAILVILGMLLGFTGLILHAVINATRRKW